MPFTSSPCPRRSDRSFLLRAAALVLMVSTVLPPSLARADVPNGQPVARSVTTPSIPPALPDAAHVTQGCYISTLAYLAQFQAAFPAEQGAPLRVDIPTFDGPHTVALITWQGSWWARDEYCGVFALDRAVTATPDLEPLRAQAETLLRRIAARLVKARKIQPVTARNLPPAVRESDVAIAATLLPCRSEKFLVRCGARELPFLFFQPAPGRIAVYDPMTGTATADCNPTDVPELVRLVAARLGYPATSARAEGTSVASNTAGAGELLAVNAR